MIFNLTGSGTTYTEADFLIIGAGTIGIPVATLLAKKLKNKKVVVLESGDKKQLDDSHPLNNVVLHSKHYMGATRGRFRCLGGTSTRWGGALLPFQTSDLSFEGWPTNLPCIDKYIPQVESIFGLARGGYEENEFPYALTDDFIVRSAKWPRMKNLNVYNIFNDECIHLSNLDIWINATATKFDTKQSDHIEITAQSLGGDKLCVSADKVIITAGAIETTRLALLINQQNNNIISDKCPNLGRYFSDHVSVPIATISTNNKAKLNKILGFHFDEKGLLRKPRIELANGSLLRSSLPPSYIHIEALVNKPSGFDALRDYYKFIQMKKRPTIETFLQLFKHTPWLMQAFFWRYFHKRLLFPNNANIEIHTVIQQYPNRDNRITLSGAEKDSFNLPLAEIDWRTGSVDVNNIFNTADTYENMWKSSDLSSLGEWTSFSRSRIIDDVINNSGYYHPTSSTRMTDIPSNGVVDMDLQLFTIPRIQLLSTSVLPTGGGANPTMMLMCLGMRCVEQHIKQATNNP
jgi:choline dehydrogenase-like flavoprotein